MERSFKRVVAGRIARMDDSTLVPVPGIDFNRIVHIDLEFTRVLLRPCPRLLTTSVGPVCNRSAAYATR
jgi:hypothetical protein